MRRVEIFDTTLRDGEQSPGISLSVEEKVEIARQLARLKVDVIEAGFPITSEGDFESEPHRLGGQRAEDRGPRPHPRAGHRARLGGGAVVTEAAHPHFRRHQRPAHRAPDALQPGRHTAEGRRGRGLRKSLCENVEFSPMDATRTDIGYLSEIVAAAVEAGADVVNIADTVGYTTPVEFADFLNELQERVPALEERVLSVHCHDDLGMAVANSLAGVEVGAGQVEVAVNGIGERAGNASLEEVVMALATRSTSTMPRSASRPASSPTRAAWSPISRATRFPRTRPSWGAMPFCTSRASTRTACSRTGGRSRS